MENYEIFRMCVTARAVAASSAPRMRRQVMRHPPFWSGGAGARSSARRHIKRMTQANRLTSWTGKRSESGATGRESQACRAVNTSGPLIPAKRRPPPNESEGVAGAKRSRTPINPPQAEPSKRAMRAVGEAGGRSGKSRTKRGKGILTPATYHYVTGPAGIYQHLVHGGLCRVPRSRCLVLLDVLPDLFIGNPIFLADLDRLQALGLDHLAYRFHMHLQEICDFFGSVKGRGGDGWSSWHHGVHLISPPQGA